MVDGFLIVDKPAGMTSHDVVDEIRRMAGTRKVGHAGTLDPMATGVLIVAIGRATRLIRFLGDLPKTYRARIAFGIATDTLDAEGEEVARVSMHFDEDQLTRALEKFTGTIEQVPPMVSAVKVGGRRLYELAREGEEVERPHRTVTIDELTLEEFVGGELPQATIRVMCSGGTYIRTLADDLGRVLGGYGHISFLRRLAIGRFEQPVAIEELAGDVQSHLLRPAKALCHLPVVTADLEAVRHGRPVPTDITGHFLIVDARGELAAVYLGREGVGSPEVVLT